MARIGSSLSGVDYAAQNALARAMQALAESSLRLSTLQRINRGSDDPAGLIAVEHLRSELTALEAADSNAARATAYVDVADSALAQVGDLLNTIRGNVVASAGNTLSDAERAANQLEVDAALEAINRIGSSTSLGGRNLLDGSAADLQFALSGNPGELASLSLPNVNTAALGSTAGTLDALHSGGAAALDSPNLGDAIEILDGARDQVLEARARAGAFEAFTIRSTRSVLAETRINLSAAISQIADTDVALESSYLIQARLLARAAVGAISIANHRRELTLGLLSALDRRP